MKQKTVRVTITVAETTATEVAERAELENVPAAEIYRQGLKELGIDVPDIQAGNPELGKETHEDDN